MQDGPPLIKLQAWLPSHYFRKPVDLLGFMLIFLIFECKLNSSKGKWEIGEVGYSHSLGDGVVTQVLNVQYGDHLADIVCYLTHWMNNYWVNLGYGEVEVSLGEQIKILLGRLQESNIPGGLLVEDSYWHLLSEKEIGGFLSLS